GAAVRLEGRRPRRAGGLVSVLLRRDEACRDRSRCSGPAEPDAGEKRLRGRPGLHDHVGAERPKARQAVLAEAELAVRDVLENEEAIAARQLDERLAALAGKAHTGRVLEVRNAVEQLRLQTCGE